MSACVLVIEIVFVYLQMAWCAILILSSHRKQSEFSSKVTDMSVLHFQTSLTDDMVQCSLNEQKCQEGRTVGMSGHMTVTQETGAHLPPDTKQTEPNCGSSL